MHLVHFNTDIILKLDLSKKTNAKSTGILSKLNSQFITNGRYLCKFNLRELKPCLSRRRMLVVNVTGLNRFHYILQKMLHGKVVPYDSESIVCARHISGITLIRYTQNRKIGNPNDYDGF